MLTQGEDVEVHALRQRGWTVSAIARHLGRDPKTARYADILSGVDDLQSHICRGRTFADASVGGP